MKKLTEVGFATSGLISLFPPREQVRLNLTFSASQNEQGSKPKFLVSL